MSSKVISQALPVPTVSPGIADIVGFGSDGVVILRNSVNLQTPTVINDFGYNAGGWRVERHVRLLADTTGNKALDVVGFGENGVLISVNSGNNKFSGPGKLVLADFSYSVGGWRVEKHIRFVADIRNVGRADIVGFGDAGLVVSQNNGNGNFSASQVAVSDFGYNAGGWRLERHLRFLADVTGDGRLDIVGFGENNVLVGRNNGNETFTPGQAVINDLCYSAGGWRIEKHPRFVADLTGDGKADIIGFGETGVHVSINNGNGTFGAVKIVLNDFCVAQGWEVSKHPRLIADLTGDKRGDIIGFGDQGVYISLNNGDGTFQPSKLVLRDFGVLQEWKVDKHPRFAVDLTGDGTADIIGFGGSEVLVSYNDGKGNFGPVKPLTTTFAYNDGQWGLDNTVRYVANLY